MHISRLDLDDPASLTAVTQLVHAAMDTGSPWLHRMTVEQLSSALRHGHDGEGAVTYVGRNGDRVVATGSLHMSSWDNLDAAWMDLTVHPDLRGRGLGSEMLDFLERAAGEHGRSKLGAAAWDGASGVGFAEGHGYAMRSQAVLRRQHLDTDGLERVRELHREASGAAADYDMLHWTGRTPDDLLTQVAAVAESINDAPRDDLDLEADTFDPDRVRGYEIASEQRNRTVHRVVARHRGSGELSGLSVLVVERETPDVAYQHDTTVVPAHRGHRLGLLMKAEMLLRLADAEPQLRTVDTWNAESNEHMVAVNEALGYRWTARQLQFQKVVR